MPGSDRSPLTACTLVNTLRMPCRHDTATSTRYCWLIHAAPIFVAPNNRTILMWFATRLQEPNPCMCGTPQLEYFTQLSVLLQHHWTSIATP
jgi:hypothetical protein